MRAALQICKRQLGAKPDRRFLLLYFLETLLAFTTSLLPLILQKGFWKHDWRPISGTVEGVILFP